MTEGNSEIQKLKLELHKLIEDKFKTYRNSGIAFSVTMISISFALAFWANDLISQDTSVVIKTSITFQILFLALTIFSCLFMQFANYQGYKHKARAHLDGNQKGFENATWWFDKEDFAIYFSSTFFLISFGISVFLYFAR